MQRPHFQHGRILRTSDFVDEQAYHLTPRRRRNATSHVWGIAHGLEVVVLEGQLMVKPGTAIDGFGRDVVLQNAHALNLHAFEVQRIDTVDVWIVYDRQAVAATGGGIDLFADAATVELTGVADIDPRKPPGVSPADLAWP